MTTHTNTAPSSSTGTAQDHDVTPDISVRTGWTVPAGSARATDLRPL